MDRFLLIVVILVLIYFYWSKGKTKKNNNQYISNQESIDTHTSHKQSMKKDNIERITLNEEQQRIFNIIEHSSINAYITGQAGTGKSILLQYFVRKSHKNVAVVAPTGVAALNVRPSIHFSK